MKFCASDLGIQDGNTSHKRQSYLANSSQTVTESLFPRDSALPGRNGFLPKKERRREKGSEICGRVFGKYSGTVGALC